MNKIEETNNNGVNTNSEDSEDGMDAAFENPVMKIIRGFSNVSHDAIRAIRDSDITYKDLSALSDKDLELFGISDAVTRREIIAKLSNTPNQADHFDQYIEGMDATEYKKTVYKNIQNQLRMMNMVMDATQQTMKANPIKRDKLLDDNVYVSSLNTKTIKEILKTVSYMTGISQPRQWSIWLYSIAGIALLGTFAIFRKIR